jgi:hypothetical protein
MKQSSKIFNNRAQSILELAIFGSIVLFLFGILIQYGMSLNYQQHLSMQTFRKALGIAKSRGSTSPNVTLTVVKDLPMPSPSNPFAIGETSPIVAQASGVWSRDVSSALDITESERPRTDIMINDTKKTYTTGIFRCWRCYGGTIRKKETDYDKIPSTWDERMDNPPVWYWERVEDRKLRRGDFIDVDNDDKCEQIVKTDPEVPKNEDAEIERFWYVDFKGGDIDSTIDPEEGIQHGLQPGYTKDVEIINAEIGKTETSSGIRSSRRSKIKEIIKRTIKTSGGDVPIESEIERERSSDWQTSW